MPIKNDFICDLCGCEDITDLKYLSIFVMGSEGIYVCSLCRLALTEFARGIRSTTERVEHRIKINRD